MSIIIRPDQINLIVYKYLLELGYKHSAFVFESEAKIDPLNPQFKEVPVNFLPQICEQSLILRSLEIHGGLKEAEECTVDLDLLNSHECQISRKKLEERKVKLSQVNMKVALQLKEDLRIQAEQKIRREEEIKQQEEERKREAERRAQLERFKPQAQQPAPSVGSYISHYDDHKEIGEDLVSNFGDDEAVAEENGAKGTASPPVLKKPRVNNFDLPENLSVLEKYDDGFNIYFLLEDKLDGKLRGYIVSEITQDTFKPVFILPESLIHRKDGLKVELQLSKYLILKRSDNVIHFINYHRRELHDTLQLEPQTSIKSIKHVPRLGIFSLITSNSLKILDDFSLKTQREIKGDFKSAIFKLNGVILILTESKKILKRSLEDPSLEEEITIGEGEIEEIKISSNELYFAAKITNPYSLGIWVNDQKRSLFTFNENNKFDDFLFEGDGLDVSTYAVCYDQEYMKIWDCDYGCFRQNYDYSRKKLKQIESLMKGRLLIVVQERGNKVKMINTETGEEDVLKESEEDSVRIIKLSDSSISVVESGRITVFDFDN